MVGVWVGDAQSVEDIAELAQRQETNTQHGCQHTSHSLQAIGLRCHSLFFAETTAQQWGTCRAALTWPALMAPNANRWASCIRWISWLEAEQPPVPSSQSRKARECACYTSGLLPHKHFCKDLTAPTVVWSTLEGSSLQSSSMPSSKPPMKMRLWGGCSICMIQKLVARASRAACTWHCQTWCCFSWVAQITSTGSWTIWWRRSRQQTPGEQGCSKGCVSKVYGLSVYLNGWVFQACLEHQLADHESQHQCASFHAVLLQKRQDRV